MNKRSDKMKMYNILTDSYFSIEDMILSEIVTNTEEWGENPLFFSVKGSIIGEKSVKFLYHSFYGFCLDSDGEEYISSEMLDNIDEEMRNFVIGYNCVSGGFSVEVKSFYLQTENGYFKFTAEKKGEL